MANKKKNYEKEDIFSLLCRVGSQIQSAIVITDPSIPNHPILYINEAFTKITGYRLEDLKGHSEILFKTEAEKKQLLNY